MRWGRPKNVYEYVYNSKKITNSEIRNDCDRLTRESCRPVPGVMDNLF